MNPIKLEDLALNDFLLTLLLFRYLLPIVYIFLTEPFDYTGTSVEFTFTPSNINQMLCVDIPIEDDEICEGDERFIIRLTSDDQDVTILSPSGFVNIQDDDGTLLFLQMSCISYVSS